MFISGKVTIYTEYDMNSFLDALVPLCFCWTWNNLNQSAELTGAKRLLFMRVVILP
jgi:hypothetical protein